MYREAVDTDVRRSNPYVGPRPFTRDDVIYGRKREAAQVVNLLVADRIVVMYSPSGAGKTSLIQAAVIPRLEHLEFAVLPVARVNLDPPGASNRYLASAVQSLLGAEDGGASADADMTLADALAQLERTDGRESRVLIFDQFEEIITLDPTDGDAKQEFFNQLGAALEDPHLWALFSMREEYVTALDPYRTPIPDQLDVTFRLDLLGREAAIEAIQQPAADAGVEFEDDAVGGLVDDLRQVGVQQPDGTLEQRLGLSVEPVQLQVVCQRLWESGRPDPSRITDKDVAALGNIASSLVDQSLGDYYGAGVGRVAAKSGVQERKIRRWFERELITEQGVRLTLLREAGQSGGLSDELIDQLIDARLVRAERTGGRTWLELSHDRLIAPVKTNNNRWFADNLSVIQERAALWEASRSESLLLRGEEFDKAMAEAGSDLLPIEAEYVAACTKLAARERRSRTKNRVILALLAVSMVLLVAALNFSFQARSNERDALASEAEAVRNAERADDNAEAARAAEGQAVEARDVAELAYQTATAQSFSAFALAEPDPGLAAGLAVEGLFFSPQLPVAVAYSAYGDASRRLTATRLESLMLGHDADVGTTAWAPGDEQAISGGIDGTLRLWDVASAEQIGGIDLGAGEVYQLEFSPAGDVVAVALASGVTAIVSYPDLAVVAELPTVPGAGNTPAQMRAVAWSPDGAMLAVGGQTREVRLFDMRGEPRLVQSLVGHAGNIRSLGFSSDGDRLASGSVDGTTRIWDPSSGEEISRLAAGAGVVWSLDWTPDDALLATGNDGGFARIFDVESTELLVDIEHREAVRAVEWSPDGQLLASGGRDFLIHLWTTRGEPVQAFPGHNAQVRSIHWSADSTRLLTSGNSGTVRSWAVGEATTAIESAAQGNAVAWAPDGERFVTAHRDGTAFIWDALTGDLVAELIGHSGEIWAADWSPDGTLIATGSGLRGDSTVRLWDPFTAREIARVDSIEAGVRYLAFSPDSLQLATASDDGLPRIWNLADMNGPVMFHEGHPDARMWSVAWSPDGSQLASTDRSRDGVVRVWSAETGEVLFTLDGHTAPVRVVEWSPDGLLIATASADNTVRVWTADGLEARVLEGHFGIVTTLEWSPDGTWLASSGEDGSIRIWSHFDGIEIDELADHGSLVTDLAWSPSGDRIAATGENGLTRVWAQVAPADICLLALLLTDETKLRSEVAKVAQVLNPPVACQQGGLDVVPAPPPAVLVEFPR